MVTSLEGLQPRDYLENLSFEFLFVKVQILLFDQFDCAVLATLEVCRFKFLAKALLHNKLRYLHVVDYVRQPVGKVLLYYHFLVAENRFNVLLHSSIV